MPIKEWKLISPFINENGSAISDSVYVGSLDGNKVMPTEETQHLDPIEKEVRIIKKDVKATFK